MQSFRTELENPVVEQDILKLEKQIRLFREGKIDDDKFRSLRLVRGIYGQRQQGVQMIRIKFPQGKINAKQLVRVADVSDKYSSRILHLTTRQDIQIHYVSLDVTPQLWADLEQDDITIREACGNTVRNITASPLAGVDVKEPFDVSPYVQAMFEYLLRNPVCQDMGRKIKIAFSSSSNDSAFTFMHDIGFLPVLKNQKRGFKVLIGGGLGQQPIHAFTAFEFLEANKIIPFTEALLRVFDRYGERNKRMQARLKFLVKELGQEELLRLVAVEQQSLSNQSIKIDENTGNKTRITPLKIDEEVKIASPLLFEQWKKTNVFAQKQAGYVAIGLKITQGNISSDTARVIAAIAEKYTENDLRITVSQNLLFRFVPESNVAAVYVALEAIGLAKAGFESTLDVTSCPGTTTCNLGVASSMGLALVLEEILEDEYPHLYENHHINLKISGCLNGCGQHTIANIGFQGMSMNIGKAVAPAFQVLLGGGVLSNGQGQFAEKTLKILSRRTPDALRALLNDYEYFKTDGEFFNDYYLRQGKKYFFTLLAPFADTNHVQDIELVDWGNEDAYQKAVGVGECAGVMIDLVATLFWEGQEKIDLAVETFDNQQYADAAYHAYNAMIYTAKALLISIEAKTNSHTSIIDGFDREFVQTNKINLSPSFAAICLQITENVPDNQFVGKYIEQAKQLLQKSIAYRNL